MTDPQDPLDPLTPPQTMNSAEVADLLKVSMAQLHRWTLRGALPAFRTPGGRLRHRPEEVKRFGRVGLENDLWTSAEVANLFGANRSTVLRWTRSGRLRAAPVPGRRYKYTRDAVMALARECGMTPEETTAGYRDLPYDPDDPDNAPLSEEEQRLDEIQERGLRERQTDQKRAGHRFDITEDDWGP